MIKYCNCCKPLPWRALRIRAKEGQAWSNLSSFAPGYKRRVDPLAHLCFSILVGGCFAWGPLAALFAIYCAERGISPFIGMIPILLIIALALVAALRFKIHHIPLEVWMIEEFGPQSVDWGDKGPPEGLEPR